MNKQIVVPILNNEYKVIIVWGDEKFLEKVAKGWGYPLDIRMTLGEAHRGCCFDRHECHPIIYLPSKPRNPDHLGTLAHEAVHAINHVFDKIDEGNRNSEVFAHSVGAVVREVLRNMK